jgi:hypothetical protein
VATIVERPERYRVEYDARALAARQQGKAARCPMIFGDVRTARTQASMASKWSVGPACIYDDGREGLLLGIYAEGMLVYEDKAAMAVAEVDDKCCTTCGTLLDRAQDARRASMGSHWHRLLPTVCRKCREERASHGELF